MGEKSKIAWCDHTFNPWEGCAKVSPGCTNCYAETRNKRFGGDNWGVGKPRRRTSEASWRKPLRWNSQANGSLGICVTCSDPVVNMGMAVECGCGIYGTAPKVRRPRVFCASLADWLDPEVPIEWLADLLVLIAETPHLDWLLLTKRPQLWRERMGAIAADEWGLPLGAAILAQQWLAGTAPANIWLGTTVEDERRADERIPALLTIPARVRFLSCEPLLEQVDLGLWLGDYDCHACNRRFWGDDGSRIGLKAVGFRCDEDCTSTDGTCECSVEVCPHCQTDNGDGNSNATVGPRGESDEEYHPTGIHWVIVGGESGTKARPFSLGWARSVVQQCKHSGVAVFVKQLGLNVACYVCGAPAHCVAGDSVPRGGFEARAACKEHCRHLYDDSHRLLRGANADPSEWPKELRVQQWPVVR